MYSVFCRAWEVHTGINPYSFVDVDEFGPIGIVVGACRKCDPDDLLRNIPYQTLELK
jgi:hypothetical protein